MLLLTLWVFKFRIFTLAHHKRLWRRSGRRSLSTLVIAAFYTLFEPHWWVL